MSTFFTQIQIIYIDSDLQDFPTIENTKNVLYNKSIHAVQDSVTQKMKKKVEHIELNCKKRFRQW